MEYSLICKKMIRENKSLRRNQKLSKKQYGRVRGQGPKLRVNKLYDIENLGFLDLTGEKHTEKKKEMPKDLTCDSLIATIRRYQLTGLSGNGFSTADKLDIFSRHMNADSVFIINSVECDPGLAHDEWLLRHRLQEVKIGIEVLSQCFSFKKILLATMLPISVNDAKIQVVQVPNRYPMGYEKTLVKNLLQLGLSENEYPAETGILVLNIQTVLAIGAIICQGTEVDSRYLTVEDLTHGKAVVVRARYGMEIEKVIKKALPNEFYKVIYVGEGVMNSHPLREAEKVSALTNYITYGKAPDYESATNCKSCGGCNAKCPMKINIKQIVKKVERGDLTDLKQYQPERCIGCNSCTYVCHAGKNLKEVIAGVKDGCSTEQ